MLLLSSSHRVISLLTVFISRSLPVNLHLIPSLLCVDSVLVLPLVFVRSFRFLLCVSPEAVFSASSSVSPHHMSSVICPWLYVSTLLLWFLVQPFVLLLCYWFLLDSGFFGSNPAGLLCVSTFWSSPFPWKTNVSCPHPDRSLKHKRNTPKICWQPSNPIENLKDTT